jgi:hypothetical protein
LWDAPGTSSGIKHEKYTYLFIYRYKTMNN